MVKQKPYVIGLTGGSCAGKTSFLEGIKKNFTPESVCIISQDDYYIPREHQMKDPEGYPNFDIPDALDQDAFERDIFVLVDQGKVERTRYTFNRSDTNKEVIQLLPAPVLIIEGLFIFSRPLIQDLTNLKIYIHAKEHVKMLRRFQRDQRERNYSAETIFHRYVNHVMPSFEERILPYREEADVVINNNADFTNGLRMLCGFINQYLTTIQESQSELFSG